MAITELLNENLNFANFCCFNKTSAFQGDEKTHVDGHATR